MITTIIHLKSELKIKHLKKSVCFLNNQYGIHNTQKAI